MNTANSLKIALAQLNPIVGDIKGNIDKARNARTQAESLGADLVMLPELFVAGYPTEDLVLKPAFQEACRDALEAFAAETAAGGPAVLIGVPWVENGKLHNAVALLENGRIAELRYKVDLPNYGVFDEKRVFVAGPEPSPVIFKGARIGIPICEDVWTPNVVRPLFEKGSDFLLVPNGSPYWRNKIGTRYDIARDRIEETNLPLAYLNMVGGQDELVFDGASFVMNADAEVVCQLPAFEEAVVLTEWKKGPKGWFCAPAAFTGVEEGDKADYAACVLGFRDYVGKNRFPGVVLGMSGGIDSALCATIAVDALGADKVLAVMLPYRYTSRDSLNDAEQCAANLGARYETIPIGGAVDSANESLKELFAGRKPDVAEENIQARMRGLLLMAISNKFGIMLMTTGNKSEVSVGYATLYGDMNGGFNPIKDLYKTEVYRIAALRNTWKPQGAKGPDGVVIPPNILTKAPTAELRENQKDQDSLPPYDVLDDILEKLVEEEMRIKDIVAAGHDVATVKKVERLLNIAEYKRRQAAPGVKVTHRNFGRDRRYPIVNYFRDEGK
ncbi:MAG: NAD+ synthase [Methylobacteriaceae bacterium]|nr:NAD+ synthase [Methylobacteriaceae bacterium]